MKKLNLIALVALMFGQCQADGREALEKDLYEFVYQSHEVLDLGNDAFYQDYICPDSFLADLKLFCGKVADLSIAREFSVFPATGEADESEFYFDSQPDEKILRCFEIPKICLFKFLSTILSKYKTALQVEPVLDLAGKLIQSELFLKRFECGTSGFDFLNDDHANELANFLISTDESAQYPNVFRGMQLSEFLEKLRVNDEAAFKKAADMFEKLSESGINMIFDHEHSHDLDVYVPVLKNDLKTLTLLKLLDGGVDLHTEGEKYGLPCQFREVMKQPEPATF